jgi:hypothetical protein
VGNCSMKCLVGHLDSAVNLRFSSIQVLEELVVEEGHKLRDIVKRRGVSLVAESRASDRAACIHVGGGVDSHVPCTTWNR